MMLGIMAGMNQTDILALFVTGSGMCTAGLTGYAAPRAVFFVVVRPRCSASWPVWNRLTVTQWAGFACHDAPRAVFLHVVLMPQMLSSRPVWTRRNVTCRRGENCGFSAVAVPRRSSIFPVVVRRSIPMVLLFVLVSLSWLRGGLPWFRPVLDQSVSRDA